MKKKSIIFIIILCLSIVVSGCIREETIPEQFFALNNGDEVENYGPNLMVNAGLEEWDYFQSYWNARGWLKHNNGNVKRDNEIVCEGHFSARMMSLKSGATARIDQVVPVTPGSKIKIRFKYYVSQWTTNGARTYCYYRTGPTESTRLSLNDMQALYDSDEYYIIRGGGRGIKYLPHTLNTWLIFEETIMIPPMVNFFEFGINSYFENTIYVDDCYVGELIE